MKGGHLIYCISNASTDSYENTLTRFSNFLTKNLEISKRQDWEVRVVAFGLHLNVKEDFTFDMVQVKSDIVLLGPIGNSGVLCVADLPSSKNGKYFYHSLKNVRYYPIQNTSISVGIEFLNASDKVLSLKTGQPSIVLLHLQKTKQTTPYLTNHIRIDSKMDDGIKPLQRNNDFKVHLSCLIYLNEGEKIALANISFPNRISSITKSVVDKKIEVTTQPFRQEIEADLGQQKKFAYLIHRLNEKRENVVCNFFEFEQVGKTKKSGDLFFKAIYIGPMRTDDQFKSPEVKVQIPAELKNVLGIEEEDFIIGPKRKNFISRQPLRNPNPTETFPALKIVVTMESMQGHFSIKKRKIKTSDDLIKAMNETMSKDLQALIRISNQEKYFKVERSGNEYKRSLVVRLKVPREIRLLLGIRQDEDIILTDGSGQFISHEPLNPLYLYPGVMICYANFVKHSVIGDEFYPVLKIIPINREEEEDKYVTEHFENFEYLMCNTTRLDLLHFQLKRLDGELINFETNEKIMINLAIQNPK